MADQVHDVPSGDTGVLRFTLPDGRAVLVRALIRSDSTGSASQTTSEILKGEIVVPLEDGTTIEASVIVQPPRSAS